MLVNNKQNLSFGQLKGIQYLKQFNPKKNVFHAQAVNAFYRNTALQNFMDKFDVKAKFVSEVEFGSSSYISRTNLYLLFGPKEKSCSKNLFSRIASFFSKNKKQKYPYVVSAAGACSSYRSNYENVQREFIKSINSINDDRLNYLIQNHGYFSDKPAEKIPKNKISEILSFLGIQRHITSRNKKRIAEY